MFKLLCVLFSLAMAVRSMELNECKCWEDYAPTNINGSPKCMNNIFFHVVPCDVYKKPKCECTGSSGIITNSNGSIWCALYSPQGQQLKRWECENKADWKAYYAAHPEEQFKQYN